MSLFSELNVRHAASLRYSLVIYVAALVVIWIPAVFILPNLRGAFIVTLAFLLALHAMRITYLFKTTKVVFTAKQRAVLAGPAFIVCLLLTFAYVQTGSEISGFVWGPFKSALLAVALAQAFSTYVDFAVVAYLQL